MTTRRAAARWPWCGVCLFISACIGPSTEDGSSSGSRAVLQIEPAELIAAVQGSPYQQPLVAEGVTPLRWAVVDGSLPPGLTLNTSSGTIAGTPTVAGTFSFTVAVQDNSFPARRGQRDYILDVIPRLVIDAQLEPARKDTLYSHTVGATGGTPPYTFSIVGLPAGLTYDEATGQISGTPLNPHPGLPLLITAVDSGSPPQEASAAATLVVKAAAVSITTTELIGGSLGRAYSARLEATNGQPPYRWAVIAGVLPDGLRLSTTTGLIRGTPTASGMWAFTVQVTDADQPASTDSRGFTITIAP